MSDHDTTPSKIYHGVYPVSAVDFNHAIGALSLSREAPEVPQEIAYHYDDSIRENAIALIKLSNRFEDGLIPPEERSAAIGSKLRLSEELVKALLEQNQHFGWVQKTPPIPDHLHRDIAVLLVNHLAQQLADELDLHPTTKPKFFNLSRPPGAAPLFDRLRGNDRADHTRDRVAMDEDTGKISAVIPVDSPLYTIDVRLAEDPATSMQTLDRYYMGTYTIHALRAAGAAAYALIESLKDPPAEGVRGTPREHIKAYVEHSIAARETLLRDQDPQLIITPERLRAIDPAFRHVVQTNLAELPEAQADALKSLATLQPVILHGFDRLRQDCTTHRDAIRTLAQTHASRAGETFATGRHRDSALEERAFLRKDTEFRSEVESALTSLCQQHQLRTAGMSVLTDSFADAMLYSLGTHAQR